MSTLPNSTAEVSVPLVAGGLFDLLLQATAKNAQKIVLKHNDIEYSYAQALARTLYLAQVLHENGISRGDRVGLYFPNHSDFLSTFFAISCLGATVVPINPLLKAEEIGHVLADSQAVSLICHSRFVTAGNVEMQATLTSLALKKLFLLGSSSNSDTNFQSDSLVEITTAALDLGMAQWLPLQNKLIAAEAKFTTSPIGLSDDLALIVYTSGTTGKPKGAMLSFSNIFTAVNNYPLRLDVNSTDRLAAVLPLCHLYGLIVVLLGTVKQSATMILLEQFEAKALSSLIAHEQITVLPAVPTMFQFLSLELDRSPVTYPALRLGLCGGSAMPVELMKKLENQLAVPILEGWALTESSVIATFNPKDKRKYGSVGPAMPGLEVSALAKDGIELPSGPENIGDLCIRGANIMKGYLNNPDATADTIKNGWLLTGDLGYLDSEGYVYVVGRSKELIIRGGMNIYPREVESTILRMDGIRDVAVIGVPDQYMGERVKAFVVAESTINESDIKAFCARHMADYKVPRLIEFVDNIPKNSTGKVLKRLLS